MINSGYVKARVKSIFSLNNDEIKECDTYIEYAVKCVSPMIKDNVDENDIRIVHLCALKAYYYYSLMRDDSISSFSAGEVSYTLNTDISSKLEALIEDAAVSCKDLLKHDNSADFMLMVV